MARQLSQHILERETESYRGSGGISQENAGAGFRPAFYDTATCRIHLSRFANGAPAPFHLLDGMPDEVVALRDDRGRPVLLAASVVSGFLREGRFYTRDEAVAQLACAAPAAADALS
jgi:hypothetical protein